MQQGRQHARAAGAEVAMTDPDLPSGSDRVHAALQAFDPGGAYDVAVNLQGDMPTMRPAVLPALRRTNSSV